MAYPIELKTGGVIMSADLAANVTSDIVHIERSTIVGLDMSITNDNNSVGSIAVQVCNDLSQTTPNWVAIGFTDGTSTATSIAVTDNVDLAKFLEIETGGKYLRVSYTATSGGGGDTLRVSASVKRNAGGH